MHLGVQAGKEADSNHIGKIIEFFEGVDGKPYFNAHRFYKAEETVRLITFEFY